MKPSTEAKIVEAIKYCDDHDKSTEFMIQYIQDFAGVSHDCTIKWLYKHRDDAYDLEKFRPDDDDSEGQRMIDREIADY